MPDQTFDEDGITIRDENGDLLAHIGDAGRLEIKDVSQVFDARNLLPPEEGGPLPKPGSFGLSRIGGLTGKLIAAGQAFSGDGSRWTHAFIVLDDIAVIEAMPGGARIAPLADYLAHAEVAFSDKPIADALAQTVADVGGWDAPPTDPVAFQGYLEQVKREAVVSNARRLEGTGYGYLQYVCLGLIALGFKPIWLQRYVASKGRMICSQLVDEVYRRAGIQLFDDGRLPQQVTPGDLAHYAGIA